MKRKAVKAIGPAPFEGVYGPSPGQSWRVADGRVCMVRKRTPARALRMDAQPMPIEIDAARSAVVVVDMQNDFCHPGGWFGQKGIDVRPMRRPIPVIAALLPAWRRAGGRIVWLNWGVRPDRANLAPVQFFKSKHRPGGGPDAPGYAERSAQDRGRALVTGDWGACVVDELAVAPGDLVVAKHRLSGFRDNELDSVLRLQGIDTLLFAGVNTDRCVFSTLQDAGFLGYDCVLLADACSTPSPGYVTRAIHFIVAQLHGFIATSSALLEGLSDASDDPHPLRSRS